MKRPAGAVLLGLICIMIASAGTAQQAAGPGTIEYALDRPDGARVSLTMVVVGRVNSNGVSVHEWWDKTSPVIAIFDPPSSVIAGMTLDIEGRTTTLSNGKRAILADRIAYYLDHHGSVLISIPPLKGTLDPSVWPSKGWIAVGPPRSGIQSLSVNGTITVLDDPEPPSGGGGPPPPVVSSFTAGTIPWAKSLADLAGLSPILADKVVTAATGQVGENCIYIEERDRSSGIRVYTDSSVVVGARVDVSGYIATNTDGERIIYAAEVISLGTETPIKPSGIVQRDLGGGDFAYNPTTGAGQQGVYDASLNQQVIGLNNIGLLVKTWGKVTYVGDSFFYLDDGSKVNDGSGHLGVRVEAVSGILLPALNATLEVVGISSCRVDDERVIRVLRVRSQDDVPVVIHVRPGGNDANDGSTWALAKATVQGATDAALPGAEIWVAAGTYGPTPPAQTITLSNGTGLYGGFAGNEIRRNGRDVLRNVTILDGGGTNGSVVTCPSTVTSTTIIDGFTIRNGKGTLQSTSRYGGGIYCASLWLTIRNNTITNNSATEGAGVYCSSSSPTIAGNIIANNTAASHGGGIHCGTMSPRVTNNTITNNMAVTSGGGVFCGANARISNNIVALNDRYGIYRFGGGPVLCNNCVYGNGCGNYGGVSPGSGDISADPKFTDLASGNLHIQPNSPCVNAGWNSALGLPITDIDGQVRTNGSHVDIGADEYHHSDGCLWYRLTVEASLARLQSGSTSTITVTVTDPVTEEPVSGRRVDFAITNGELVTIYNDNQPPDTWTPDDPPTTGYGITGADGRVCADVTRETAGWVTITARVSNSCETGETVESTRIGFINPGLPADVVFVIDRSESMGYAPEHQASYPTEASVQRFVRDISALKPDTRFGAIMFNTGITYRSISQFVGQGAVDAFCLWVYYYGAATNGTTAQIDALNRAADDLGDPLNSPPSHRRFVVYVTDAVVDSDARTPEQLAARLAVCQRLDSLTGPNGGVFISLWEQWQGSLYQHYNLGFTGDPAYPSLVVNGGFDHTNYPNSSPANGRYLFDNLKNRILYGQ